MQRGIQHILTLRSLSCRLSFQPQGPLPLVCLSRAPFVRLRSHRRLYLPRRPDGLPRARHLRELT
eukprot:557277-Pleurochrysis_carterae.AAC.1